MEVTDSLWPSHSLLQTSLLQPHRVQSFHHHPVAGLHHLGDQPLLPHVLPGQHLDLCWREGQRWDPQPSCQPGGNLGKGGLTVSPLNTFQSSLATGSTKTLRRRCPGGLRRRAAMESGGHKPCRYPGGSRGRAALSRAENCMVLGTEKSGESLRPLGTPLVLPRVMRVRRWSRCRDPAEPTHHQRSHLHPPRP